VFSSQQELDRDLRASGYIPDCVTVTTVFLASRLHRPLLLEGPAGSGKTELAYAVATAARTHVERLQCYDGIDEAKAIGRFDESLQRLFVELKARSPEMDWRALGAELQRRQFFIPGPLLRALEQDSPPVLLIDELDKVGPAFEAQSFKRSAACFGLGRYLYYFEGVWVDLDDRKRPRTTPQLPEWATPEGWIRGLRPNSGHDMSENPGSELSAANGKMIGEIEALAGTLGRGLYRGILRDLAKAWNPREIHDVATGKKVLEYMHAAERGLQRLQTALERTGDEALIPILESLGLRSLERVDNLDTLKKIVIALENTA
jgi:hypothetical protein